MRGHLDARRRRQPGRPLPTADAADAFDVGHDVVAGPSGEGRRHGLWTGEVLADLDRAGNLTGDLGAAGVVVVADRLLDSVNALAVERPATPNSLRPGQRLVVVDHQRDVIR